jgi:ABC-type multidrug transport system fused ATPase/permease subunit
MGAGAGMMQRQYDPRQRIDPRRGAGPKQEYAPPMSELFSLDMNAQADEGDDAARVSDGVGDGDDWKGYEERMHDKQLRESETTQHPEEQNQHPDLQHETDTDDDSEMSHAGSVPDMFEAQSQSALMSPKVGTSIPPKASGFRQPQQMRQGPPRGQRPLPRVTPQNRMTDSWPNGGSMASSSPSRRQYTYYDDDNESIGSKVKSVIGSVPVPHIPRFFKGKGSWVDSYDDSAWSDYESKEKTKSQSASTVGSSLQGRRASMGSLNNAAVPRPVMSLLGKRNSLVSSAGARRCASVGRTQAILDAGQLALIVFSFHEILPTLHNAVSANAGYLRSAMLSTILSSIDGWAPYALCAAFLLSASNSAWIKPSLKALLSEVAAESEAESAYSQLYLRLISSIPMKKSFPDVVRKAARAEALNTIAASRLHFFTTLAVAYVLLSTVAVLKPAGSAVMSAAVHSIKLDAWKATPIVWSTVLEQMKTVGLDLVRSLRSLFYTELEEVRQQPLRVVVVLSLLATLMLVSYLPSLERSRKGNPKGSIEDDEAEDTISSLWSAIGSSSATRIGILSSPRGVEGALDQFSKLRPDRAACAGMLLLPQGNAKLIKMKRKQQRPPLILRSVKPLFREVAYLVSSILALLVPLAIYTYVWAKPDSAEGALSFKTIPIDGWTSLVDLAALLFMTNIQLGRAAHYAIGAADARLGTSLTTFFRTLSSTVDELQNLAASSANSDFQSMLTASPTEGVVITDLWAAHSTRKAWAVKGANVQCKNGEVVLIIGSDGAGKSRLLTSISEHIFAPPKSARTTTYVRGSIKVAGVDLSKWDRNQLQRRVGVWLNDVRTVSDYASLFTGCTLEEILEPIPLVGGASRQTGAKEKSALALAMKITGLGSKLSTRLPSKLSTVVSANEDELKPSPLRPPSYPLSPSDWSRVLLTKVLAQLIAGNDNQQSSPNNIAKCLVGSTLLLDDATSQMSEVDEAHCITALRSTGAAVILTSNRWATGRFSDRIVVIENGSVIESGTHADLINLGPERSLYARQWNNMASI